MSLLKKLEIAENFSESEKSIAQYILQNSEEVLNLSTIELAKKNIYIPGNYYTFMSKA